VPEAIKQERLARFMQKQAAISAGRLAARIGTEVEVVIDGPDEHAGLLARSYAEAPEVDGIIHIATRTPLAPGSRARVRIVSASEHDLGAELR